MKMSKSLFQISSIVSSSSSLSSLLSSASFEEEVILIDKIFRISNPCYSYYDFDGSLKTPNTFSDFYYLLPESEQNIHLYTPTWPPRKHSPCDVAMVKLWQTSEIFEKSIYVKTFDCTLDACYNLDRYIVNKDGKELFSQFNYIINEYVQTPLPSYIENVMYYDYKSNGLAFRNDPFHCVEATSLSFSKALKGTAASIYSAYQFSGICDEEQINRTLTRWGLELVQLMTSFSPLNLTFSFLRLLNDYINVKDIIMVVGKLFHATYEFLSMKVSQQPSSDPCVDATSLDLDLSTLASLKDSTPALASALATICVIFGIVIVGKDVSSSSRYDTISQKIAETMVCITKFRSGVHAVRDILSSFSTYLYETIFDLLGLESESELLRFVRAVDVSESQDCKKESVFDYCKFLINPSNLILIQSNSAFRKQLEFSYKVLDGVRFMLSEQPHSLSQNMITYISNTITELQKVRKAISKTSTGQSSRFCPFWINFVGDSHTGKSTLMSILSKYMIQVLSKVQEKESIDFEIPSLDNCFYPVNFCDKFETNYTGQYMTLIDDFAQDGPGASETSSALKMINWISSVPYFTNQAHLDNKGIPFTSKIILSSSNDLSLRNRKEIINVDALVNRMSLCFNFILDPTQPANDWCPKPCRIELWDFKNNKSIKQVTIKELLQICVEKYIVWFRKEMKLDNFRKVDNSLVNEIFMNLNYETFKAATLNEVGQTSSDNQSSVNQIDSPAHEIKLSQPCVDATSSLRCLFGMQPNIKDSLFDCDCTYHSEWNGKYNLYLNVSDHCDLNIIEFVKHSTQENISISILKEKFCSAWKLTVAKAKSLLEHPYAKLIAGAIGLILTGTMALTWYRSANESDDSDMPEVVPSAKYSLGVKRARGKRAVIATSEEKVEATSGIDKIMDMFDDTLSPNGIDIARNVIIQKGLVCTLKSPRRLNTGLRIHGTAILTNHHFLQSLKEGEKLEISYNDQNAKTHNIEQVFNKNRMYRIDNTDLAVYKCDHALPSGRSILKHFPDNVTMPDYVRAIVLTADPVPMVYTNVIAKPTIYKSEYKVDDQTYNIIDSYETNCPVRYGMSGSVLFSVSSNSKHKILGIQTCKNKDQLNEYGYFKPVSRPQLEKAMKQLDVVHIEQDVDLAVESTSLMMDDRCPPNLKENSLTYLGTIAKTKRIQSQNVSKIKQSMIHDLNKVTQEPSVLSDYDIRMRSDLIGKPVIFRAIEGFDHQIGSVDNNILTKSVKQLSIEYDVQLDVTGIPRRILTDYEMVNGVPGVMLQVDMRTSPGYPYVLERKDTTKGGKFEWFTEEVLTNDNNRKVYHMKPSLACGLEQADNKLRNGEMPLFLAYCCLKDETRPLKKIEDGKTRAFICLPLHYNLLIRKYFGAFTSAQKKRAGIISSCVGVDPANDWVRIYDKLKNKNSLWEDFDYANWDQYLHPELVMKVADIINHWYNDGEVNARVRKLLLYNLVHTIVIVKDRLFLKSQGQCSGCAITAELNCLVHDLLMTYVWFKLHQDAEIETSLSEMRDYVAICVYGDDIIMAVDDDCDINFNGTTIAPVMQQLGMNITPGDKVSTTFDLKKPEKIFFLKRNFVLDGERVLAPLRSDIVENIIQWIHKSDNDLEATRINCVTALQESYMHREQYFNKLVDEIHGRIKLLNKARPGLNFNPILVDYEDLERKHYSGHYVCAGLYGVCAEEV
uniref:Nonstructural polyprotein n=1 Tax=Soybean thrips bicistronic virus 1 TaxID=2797877 RepID=A0A7T7WMM0_9VIRU|nr:nonstructural polyprotein [Soybean thrips bicistronic virus 1]